MNLNYSPRVQRAKALSNGAVAKKCNTTLFPVPKNKVSVEDDILTVTFDFPITTPALDFPNDPVVIMFYDRYDIDTNTTHTVIVSRPVDATTVQFGLPLGGLDAVDNLWLGYSNGVFGGCTRPRYVNRLTRMVHIYDIAVFNAKYHNYSIKGDKITTVLYESEDIYTKGLYIGYSEFVIGDDYQIGGTY